MIPGKVARGTPALLARQPGRYSGRSGPLTRVPRGPTRRMTNDLKATPPTGLRTALDHLGMTRPDVPLMAPFMAYLLLLGLTHALPATWQPVTIGLRGVLSLAVVWVFRRHLPPLGRPNWLIAVVGGVLVGWGWIVGQIGSDHFGMPGRLPGFPGEKAVVDPRDALGADGLFWATWWLRMSVAVIAVPVVEELFWRGFVLRVMIDWHHFERVPLGRFTWFSFIGTALLSTLQHPDNWAVSVACWMIYNAIFYWTRSLLCLMLLHGVTNLALYVMVLRVGDWSHW